MEYTPLENDKETMKMFKNYICPEHNCKMEVKECELIDFDSYSLMTPLPNRVDAGGNVVRTYFKHTAYREKRKLTFECRHGCQFITFEIIKGAT